MKFYIQHINEKVIGYLDYRKNDNDIEIDIDEKEIQNLPFYKIENNNVFLDTLLKEKVFKNDSIFNKICELKKLLDSSDYQVIKCYEASLLNEEMPYDLQELLTQRKAWREEINSLENTYLKNETLKFKNLWPNEWELLSK
jgi:hypothetical protein